MDLEILIGLTYFLPMKRRALVCLNFNSQVFDTYLTQSAGYILLLRFKDYHFCFLN